MNRSPNPLRHLHLAFAAVVAASAGLAAPLPAFAQSLGDCDGECPAPSPPPAPTPPSMPHGTDIYGNFFADPNGSVVQGQVANGVYWTFGGGLGSPYLPGQTLSYGNSGSGVQLQASLAPIASAFSSAVQGSAVGRSDAGMGLSYRVLLVADDQAAADQISGLLSTSGAIAWVSGSYHMTASGYGYGSVAASTGTNELASSLAGSFYTKCGSYGVATAAGSTGCGAGTFSMPVNFVSGSSYLGGNPLSFVSEISLSTEAQAGVAGCCGGGYAGSFSAYIDPTVTLASGIHASLILGDNGNVANTLSPVPEPQQWALLLGGLLMTVGAMRRRQRRD